MRSGGANPIGLERPYLGRMRVPVRLTAACALVLALAGVVALGAPRAAVSSTLDAYVNDDGNIGLTYADGTPVGKAIPPGTYTIVVDDSTTFHNFHLYGPGFDRSTDVGSAQKETWTATFQSGATYTYVCDLHADSMLGQFTATNNPASVAGGTGGNGAAGAPVTSGAVQSNGGPTKAAAAAKTKAKVKTKPKPKPKATLKR